MFQYIMDELKFPPLVFNCDRCGFKMYELTAHIELKKI
jgi:hypothetical protein